MGIRSLGALLAGALAIVANSNLSATEPLEISMTAGGAALDWQFPGVLQSASGTLGGWTDIAQAVTTVSLPVTGASMFFRVRKPTFTIVDTNQIICYNATGPIATPAAGEAGFGQDPQFAGPAPSYIDHGDGTVTDLNTGLMWVQARGSKVTWAAAVAGAASHSTGGHHDWRMPTLKELYSLIRFNGVNGPDVFNTAGYVPFIDTDHFGFSYGSGTGSERVIDCQDWSATEYVSTTMNGDATVFGVNFADGRIKGYPKYQPGTGGTVGNTLHVRYVRGNPSYGKNSFTDNGDGTVTDLATGLMWSQADSGTGMDWPTALAWVQTRNSANHLGHNDWRMPNAKELQSIVDYTRSPATSGTAAIDPVFSCTTITNENGQADYPYYWAGTTLLDGAPTPSGVYICFGRAMGYMNGSWLDVHGAGSQKSDPMTGNPASFPFGRGPQGDAVRITNFVRLVRGGLTE